MLPKTVRGAVEVAAGLVEEVGKRVVGTAAGLLEMSGVDVAEVERRLGGPFPPSAKSLQTLAEEAVTAGRAGVDLAVGVARSEVEKAFEKVGDQVTKVGVVLAYLESKLREVEEEAVPAASPQEEEPGTAAPAPRADALFGHGWELDDEPAAPAARVGGEPIMAERVEVDEPVETDPPVPPAVATKPAAEKPAERKPAAKKPVAKKAAAQKPAAQVPAAQKPAAQKPAAQAPAVKKAAAKKAGTKKPAEQQPAERQPAAKQAAAKKAPAKRTAVKKTAAATTERVAAKKAAQAAGQEPPAKKRTATRKTTVRKSSTRKPDA
ncbi:histone H1-like repetitive region-containing protein [Kitasatospora sp. NPDC086009]|uniref:histone H1-like repetitive region-containing protein n=1 Tax=unclassified Kitasatospora TaxID=2633591 RepID=UPI0037CCA532